MDIDWDEVRWKTEEFLEDYKSLILILGCVAVVFLLGYGLWMINDKATEADIANQIQTSEVTLTQSRNRLDTAFTTVELRRKDYQSTYSTGFDDSLAQARGRINGFFEPKVGLLAQLHDAQAKRNWELSKKLLSDTNSIVNQDVGTIDRILGPPGSIGQGWYDNLDAKAKDVDDGLTTKVQTKIDDGLKDLAVRKTALCGSANQMSYTDAYQVTKNAQNLLDQAKSTASSLTEGMVDKPRVYDEAKSAEQQADQISQTANVLESQAADTYIAINQCEGSINTARLFVNSSSYQQSLALGELVLAVTESQNALKSCYVQDFASANTHAENCTSYANSAVHTATRPTPTPEPPPPTAIVIHIDTSSSSDESSNYDYSSDDSSFDSGGDDSGSWDSGGSDSGSWDSGGSDSGSWDSGGSDSGSYDSGGSDSGSWDE